jgi:branched-chain amino acid transport system permease protein
MPFDPSSLLGAMPDFSSLPQQLVNGLLLGAIYALIALGYTMVYGVLRLINFAHGEVFMLGGYVALFTSWSLGYSPESVASGNIRDGAITNLIIMVVASMVICALIGMLIELLAYRPMRNQSRIAALITAIGVSLFLQFGGSLFLPAQPPPSIDEKVMPRAMRESVELFLKQPPADLRSKEAEAKIEFDNATKAFETAIAEHDGNKFDPEVDDEREFMQRAETVLRKTQENIRAESVSITLPKGQLVMLGMVLVLMTSLWYLVMKTKVGRAMRAASHDFDSASLMGVNVNVIVTLTFMIGSALAGAGSMMLNTFFGTTMQPFSGVIPGVKAFVAAVLGGIGNIPGAVLGGFLMGIAETLVVWVGYSGYKDAVAFVILIIVLLARPGGLLGSNKVEKV